MVVHNIILILCRNSILIHITYEDGPLTNSDDAIIRNVVKTFFDIEVIKLNYLFYVICIPDYNIYTRDPSLR